MPDIRMPDNRRIALKKEQVNMICRKNGNSMEMLSKATFLSGKERKWIRARMGGPGEKLCCICVSRLELQGISAIMVPVLF